MDKAAMILGLVLAIGPALPAVAGQSGDPDKALPVFAGRHDAFTGKSDRRKLKELADREELRELIAIYAHRAAMGVSLADLFTDDGAFIIHIPGQPVAETRGRAALEKAYGDIANNPGAQLPMIHNIVLQISGDAARGAASIELRGTQGGGNVIASGYYSDTFRREGTRWKFVTREVFFHHFTTLEKGWAKPVQKP